MFMYHNRGDVYIVLYPFDDSDHSKGRPAIIFDTRDNVSIVIKITSHEKRKYDDKDVPIIHWEKAGLSGPSVARCGHFVPLEHNKILKFIGVLHEDDLLSVLNRFYR